MRKRTRYVFVVGIAAVLLAVYGFAQQAQRGNPGADWSWYMGDLAGTRYSTLKQIDVNNVSQLTKTWTFQGIGGESTPIVVNGIMYVGAGNRVVALQPDTGKEVWSFQVPGAPAGGGGRGAGGGRGGRGGDGAAGRGNAATGGAPAQDGAAPPAAGARGGGAGGGGVSTRGVAYWPGDRTAQPRIFFTAGRRLMAVNAVTGEGVTTFGSNGAVDMLVPYGGVPTIYKNLIIVGAANGEVTVGDSPGDTRAYDAHTGAKVWHFTSVAQPGDPNNKTWLNDGWKNRQGVNVWGWYMTIDAERDLLYMPLGSPAGNYWGGDRPGANLYGNSIVAVDVNTGKYKWHFQTVHHDLWDSDQPSAPTLVNIRQNGRTVPALAAVSKTGWMFILDRTNGKPVFGVEERPVPKGDAPDEWYSPTQPFPIKPKPLARIDFKKEDLVSAEDTTPEHAKACQDLFERAGGFYNAGPFTPFLFHEEGAPPKSSIQFPGNGGTNWGGLAADPTNGYVFVFTQDAALTGWIEKKRPGGNYGSGNGSPQPYDRGSITGPGPYSGFAVMGMPCQKPPWGRLTAVNANTGDIAWQIPLGVTDSLPPGKQNTGRGGSAGPIATAGGLVFIGATSDARFRAIDSKTGKELWVTRLNGNGGANPMTYQAKGKQYVAITAGGTLNVFALP